MIKSLNKKFIILSLFLAYILIGSFLSITTGITSDEYHEQKNWLVNLSAIKEFIYTGKYESFLDYWDRYHWVAFQLISQPIQFLIKDFVANINNVTGLNFNNNVKNYQYGSGNDNDFYYFTGISLSYILYKIPCPKDSAPYNSSY